MRALLQNLVAGFRLAIFLKVNADHFHDDNTLLITADSAAREAAGGLTPSQPQVALGKNFAARWKGRYH